MHGLLQNKMKQMLIHELFREKCWQEIANSYAVNQVAKALSFKEGLQLAYKLLYDKVWEDELQEYAVQLLNGIRKAYPNEWNSSWQYDAFLGEACNVTFKFDERYLAYKRAYETCPSPPPRLLIELAGCCDCPGPPPISYDEAIRLAKQAIKDYPYVDGVGLLHLIYSLNDDEKNEEFWKKRWHELREKNAQSPSITPDFLTKASDV
jgi:hypothetical protein